MSKVSDFIFNISPKKLAIYLIIGPIVYAWLHVIATVLFQNISNTTEFSQPITTIFLVAVFLFLVVLVALCLLWLQSVVYAVKESDLGISRRWFNIALVLFIAYLLYNVQFLGFGNVPEAYDYIFNPLAEFIAFGGLLIAYPTICHYAARAISAKINGRPATFSSALLITLVLVFGTVLGIPFLHKNFSTKTSINSEVLIIYAIACGLFVFLLVVGFFAAVSGLV